jgi:bZIP factor
MVGPVKNEESSLSPNTNNIQQQQQHYRLQLLAQAIEKVESECSHKQMASITSVSKNPIDSLSMTSATQQQELLMQLFAQQNIAAVMAATAAAQLQIQQQQQKLEPISPPSTSSASSSVESPIDFSSRRSTDDMNECSTPPSLSPLPNQQHQLLSNMLQNLQSTNHFPFLLTNKNGKPTRPFKAYPREPLMLPFGFCSNPSPEQTNILADAASRTTPNRKRLAQTQERLKQRLEQQQLLSTTHFISSSGAQILQPPKKRHRMMENPIIDEEKNLTKDDINDEANNGIKDDAYWERRRKNNEAAKRSRDARRAKEDEIALRAAILEQENMKLRLELSQLKQETAKLRCMVRTSS